MEKLRWIEISFLLTALPQFTEANLKEITAKYGEDVTLTCENSRKPQNYCGYTTWNFVAIGKQTVELTEEGKIKDVGAKKNRLRLTEDCSLVINKVQEEDDGRYDCIQYTPARHDPESYFQLSVSSGENTKKTTTAKTSAKLTTMTTKTYARPTTMTIKTSAKPMTKPTTATTSSTKTRYSTTSQSNTTTTAQREDSNGKNWPWWSILVAAVAFILTVVVVVKVIRRKGNKMQTADSPDDPEEGVSYATISYTKNQRNTKDDGKAEDDHVTYSTVKTSSSAAVGASTDTNSLYSIVNKGKK